mgnify:FL=1|jgi:hypothetical protein
MLDTAGYERAGASAPALFSVLELSTGHPLDLSTALSSADTP